MDVKKWVKDLAPFIALSTLFIIIALIGKQSVLSDSSLLQMVLMSTKSTVFYLQKLILPTGLSVLYPYTVDLAISDFILSLVITSILVGVMLWSLLKRKGLSINRSQTWMTTGLGFFFLTLIPTFTNFSKGGDFYFASDRYVYLPSVGLLLVLASCRGVLEYWSTRILGDSKNQVLKSASSRVVILVFSWMSYTLAKVWTSIDTLC